MGKDVTFVAESYKPAREDHSPLPKLDECIGLWMLKNSVRIG